MKRFTCTCIDQQFKMPRQVYVSAFEHQPEASMPCIYKPNEKATIRQVKLDANFCPQCGAKLEEI